MATKRKKKTTTKRRRPNPAAAAFPIDRLVPVQSVRVNRKGVVTQVVIADKDMKRLERGKRKR